MRCSCSLGHRDPDFKVLCFFPGLFYSATDASEVAPVADKGKGKAAETADTSMDSVEDDEDDDDEEDDDEEEGEDDDDEEEVSLFTRRLSLSSFILLFWFDGWIANAKCVCRKKTWPRSTPP